MKKNIFGMTALAIAVLSAASCKKDDNNNTNPTRHDMMVGTWKQTQDGSDDNSNGAWDTNERNDIPAADQVTAVFNNDGTGTFKQTFMGTQITGNTKWQLMNNDNDLRVIVTVPGFDADTLNGTFTSFTSSEFIVKDASVTPADYMLFKKQ